MNDKQGLIEGYLEWAKQEKDNSVEAYITQVELEQDFNLMHNALRKIRERLVDFGENNVSFPLQILEIADELDALGY